MHLCKYQINPCPAEPRYIPFLETLTVWILIRIHSFASSLRSCQNLAILNSTQPPPKAYNLSYLKGTHNAPIGTIFSKNSSSPTSYPHPHCGLVV